MSRYPELETAMSRCPLIAILRGVRPEEVEAIGDLLIDSGFAMIEVPLNSPDPFDSIQRLAKRHGHTALIGAGTVLDVNQVAAVKAAGGRMIISPNTNTEVIAAAVARGLVSLPGYFTPSEALTALSAGANGLKLFPAEAATPAVLKAQRAILPSATPIFVVGGITPDKMLPWTKAGATGFGLGSALYRPSAQLSDIASAANQFVSGIKGCHDEFAIGRK